MDKKEIICDCNSIHQDIVEEAIKNMPDCQELIKLSQTFKILGDLTRIKILMLLDKSEMCVCDIANVLDMTKSSISHQLAVLKEANIVKYRKEGKEVYYMLDDEHVKRLYEIGIEHINHKLEEKVENKNIRFVHDKNRQ